MEKYDDIYKYLTGVDIQKEISLWDERGKGYYGEYLVFCTLLDSLPAPAKMLMNLNVPTEHGSTTEIDLIAITPVGIIVYEIKHHKGIIYGSGDGQKWTQFFKTQPNSTFLNPIKQNEYHCKALSNVTSVPLYSVVVFTNEECELKLNRIESRVCYLEQVLEISESIIQSNKGILSPFDIDSLFNKLSVFSKMTSPIAPDGNPIPFNQWIYAYHDAFVKLDNDHRAFIETEKTRLLKKNEEEEKKYSELKKKEYEKYTRKLKTKRIIEVSLVSVAVTASIISAVFSAPIQKSIYDAKLEATSSKYNSELAQNKAKYDEELERISNEYNTSMTAMRSHLDEMESKFEKVEKYKKIPLSNVLDVINLTMNESAKDNMTLSFALTLKKSSTLFVARFHSDSSILIGRKDGTVREYYLFNESYRKTGLVSAFFVDKFNNYHYNPSLITDTKPEDVSYMKITGIDLYERTSSKENLIEENAEFLLYDANIAQEDEFQ